MIGKTLAHYEITDKLGQGGMGEVWRARDTKLGREVAIKTLPEEFAKDAGRLARFEREAKLLASLNHPNIAAIYGLEEHAGTRFLVLELIEGPTLGDRIKQGAIPVEESLKLALQIAEALEAAHEKGVIHRDLKPSNIKVTPDGKVKVLDFGLAKVFEGDSADVSVSNSPTLSMQATQQGIILGTAAYMSPEQASGMATDKRADIWSLGVVLFEMLAGRPVFSGETVSHILAAVLAKDPQWNILPANLHFRLRELLERCLEKDARNRWHDVADLRVDIQKVLADPRGVLPQPSVEADAHAAAATLPWAVAVLASLVVGVAAWMLKPEPLSEPPRVVRISHVLSENQRLPVGGIGTPLLAVSPDGSRLVYIANGQLYMKALDSLEAAPIPGTDETPVAPFFSPDGQWVGYWSDDDDQLKKIPISGGAAVTLADSAIPLGHPFWAEDDTILFAQAAGGRVMRVSANGGIPEVMTESTSGSPAEPQILPDGNTLLFYQGSVNVGNVVVQPPDSGEPRILFPGVRPRYVPTGHIVYGIEGVLFAVPFDVETLEVTGGPVPMIEGLRAGTQYAVSDSGSIAYIPGGGAALRSDLLWLDRGGAAEPVTTIPSGNFGAPRLSPDGRRLLVVADNDLWVYDIATGRRSALTTDGMTSPRYYAWSPDGSQVAYSSRRSENDEIWIQAADGSGEPRQVTDSDQTGSHVESWSPDGTVLAFHQHTNPNGIYTIAVGDADAMPEPFLVTGFSENEAKFSPDGRFLAYQSNRSGEAQIYIRPYPGPGAPVTVSVDGGLEPIWGSNGELFYRHLATRAMMGVPVVTEPGLSVGIPERLFEADTYLGALGSDNATARYDVTGDGQRFIVLQNSDFQESGRAESEIVVVLNWFEELKQRVPVP